MKRFDALDSWRGIAACLVALYHLRLYSDSHLVALPLLQHSYLFVDFFFVLSGFVIAANYEQRLAEGLSLWRFALLRFGRLYPLHLSLLALCILLHLAHSASDLSSVSAFQPPFWSADTIVANLLMVHSLHVFDFPTWNQPSWSISTEFYTYLLFGLALAACKRRIGMLMIPVIVAATLALWILVDDMDTTFDWGLVRCILGFATGVLAWHARRATRLRSGTALELATLGLVVAFVWLAGRTRFSLAAPAVFAPAVLVFAAEAGAASRLLRARTFLWLGAHSYSIYLVHFVVAWLLLDAAKLASVGGIALYADGKLGRGPWQGDLAYLLYFAFVLGVAAFTYRTIEFPARAWFRRLARAAPRKVARIEILQPK
ncbi:MAG TPA: acyltransferase [Burkholderiales bacterium]|nr:acyltransferase [Burkholderiales bacterium]